MSWQCFGSEPLWANDYANQTPPKKLTSQKEMVLVWKKAVYVSATRQSHITFHCIVGLSTSRTSFGGGRCFWAGRVLFWFCPVCYQLFGTSWCWTDGDIRLQVTRCAFVCFVVRVGALWIWPFCYWGACPKCRAKWDSTGWTNDATGLV